MPGRGSYGPGGKWIYQRAKHIRSKNPEMEESTSFAIATQQAHKLGKSPKRFRTEQGVARAHSKYRAPVKMYKKTASDARLVGLFDELEKISGWKEGLKTLLTGRVPLYHGTSKARADKIIQEGLKPQGAKGVSEVASEGLKIPGWVGFADAEKGLSFASRRPDFAKAYATQQIGMERMDKVRERLPEIIEVVGKRLPNQSSLREGLDNISALAAELRPSGPFGNLSLLFGKLPGGKKVVEVSIPRTQLREGIGRELHIRPGKQMKREGLKSIHPKLEALAAIPHISDVPIQGGIPTKFIRGSKDYQKVTLNELKEHAKQVVKEPKAVAKDVLRSALGVSHSPGTLIRQGKQL